MSVYVVRHGQNDWNLQKKIQKEHRDEDVLVVTHTGILVVMNTYFYGIPEDEDLFHMDLKNCGINKYDF